MKIELRIFRNWQRSIFDSFVGSNNFNIVTLHTKLSSKRISPVKPDETRNIPIVPGRGLVTNLGTQLRSDYLLKKGYTLDKLTVTSLKLGEIQKNIESYIGALEIPAGLVGPILFNGEEVYGAAGTLEGALVASMNRGARAISLSGGFSSSVKWQKMSRAPMFEFENENQVEIFVTFLDRFFTRIKQKAESYSNYAQLEKIDVIRDGCWVHTVFFYQTGDASGQNMTTTCTWHAMLYIIDLFFEEHGITCLNYILEGNGSSDKKLSEYNRTFGRGIHVSVSAIIQEKYIREILRTTSDRMLQVLGPSKKLAKQNGMLGYSINAANAVAALFVATGQDLACIHESSVAFLELEDHKDGLFAQITLPNLVVGTVGGGTHLPKQSEALELMGCKGSGKSERLASLIAGFALGLELSTFAAIVSGEFAKAHEKLGRNRPVQWLTRHEVNQNLILSFLQHPQKDQIESIYMEDASLMEDGILTHIAARATKKLIGFEELTLKISEATANAIAQRILLKSKATDDEVIKGLHLISASIDAHLADLIFQNRNTLEYKNSHLKESLIYEFLNSEMYPFIPAFYGGLRNDEREMHLILMELLNEKDMFIFNSENNPEHWNRNAIQWAISDIVLAHRLLQNLMNSKQEIIVEFKPWENNELYNRIINILELQHDEQLQELNLSRFLDAVKKLQLWAEDLWMVPKCIIHNDFNSRNIGVRINGDLVIYDWELSVIDYPHRDIVELLAFTLDVGKDESNWLSYMDFHFQECKFMWMNLDAKAFLEFRRQWFLAYEYALLELITTRLIFYEVAGIVVKYDFSNRVLRTAIWLLEQLQYHNNNQAKN